jgi:hypothetical protein
VHQHPGAVAVGPHLTRPIKFVKRNGNCSPLLVLAGWMRPIKMMIHLQIWPLHQTTRWTRTGFRIQALHTGHSSIHTVGRLLVLRNILHVPAITKHLLSVHKFTLDNKVFVEFHPWHFLIKDHLTRKTLLAGRCKGGLYHLLPSDAAALKEAFISRSLPSRAQWHCTYSTSISSNSSVNFIS